MTVSRGVAGRRQVESHQLQVSGLAPTVPQEEPGALLAGRAREGSDGDEFVVDADVLFQFLDEQSRSLRDFIRFAREEE